VRLRQFDFIIAAVNDDSKEIVEKQEQMSNHIDIKLQGVQQAL
jgi:hypothetical protein